LLSNTEACVRHFQAVQTSVEQGTVTLHDFDAVEEMDIGAAMLLMAQFKRYAGPEKGGAIASRGSVNTTVPRSRAVLRFIASSGVLPHVSWHTRSGGPPKAVRKWRSASGLMKHEINFTVEPEVADRFARHGTHAVYGRRDDASVRKRRAAVYRAILEAMANTNNHASTDKGHEKWWMGMVPLTGGRMAYAFLDLGLGILETARLKWFRQILPPAPEDLLREIMSGRLHSRRSLSATARPYRGLGLPKLAGDLTKGYLSRLVIISNEAVADVGAGTYRKLDGVSFPGTFLYWELNPGLVRQDDARDR